MAVATAVGSGIAGAIALNLLHESARQVVPHAPRVDRLGKRAVANSFRLAGIEPPRGRSLYATALAGDLISNGAYFAAVGLAGPERAIACGALVGLAAGVGAVALPGPMGFGTDATARRRETAAMTVAWYTVGGLVAGVVYRMLHGKSRA